MAAQRTDKKRAFVGFAFAIILGWIIGILIKQVRLGLIIGLVLGLLSSSLIKRK